MLDTEGFSLPRTHTSHGCLHKIKPVTIAAEMWSCRGGIGTGPTLTVDLLAGDNRWEKRNHFFFLIWLLSHAPVLVSRHAGVRCVRIGLAND